MIDFLNGYGTSLGEAQSKIDMCNGKMGCNYICSAEQQQECPLRERHRELLHEMVSGGETENE